MILTSEMKAMEIIQGEWQQRVCCALTLWAWDLDYERFLLRGEYGPAEA